MYASPRSLARSTLVSLATATFSMALAASGFVVDVARAAPSTIASASAVSSGSAIAETTVSPSASTAKPADSAAGTAAAPSPGTSASAYAIPWSGGSGDTRAGLDPFPSSGSYLSYGLAFQSEAPLATGRLCPKGPQVEGCVLGGGAGISLSGAYRVPGYSLGAVYEVTFHDSHAIYQRGSLQQARGEWRIRPHFALIGESIAGFVALGAGIAAYGDNWALSTLGPSAHVAIGVEVELGVKLNLVVSFAYRGVYFRDFTDASGQLRLAGVTQLLGFQLGLELNEPL